MIQTLSFSSCFVLLVLSTVFAFPLVPLQKEARFVTWTIHDIWASVQVVRSKANTFALKSWLC